MGRIILGAGVGQLSVIVPLWQAESSSVGNRGRKVITAGIFICMGFLLSSWINLGFSKAPLPPLQWRVSLAIPVLLCSIICISIFTFPASNHAASIVAAVFIFLFNFFYPIGFLGETFCAALRLPLPTYERPCPPYQPQTISCRTL